MSRYGVFHPSVDGVAVALHTADTDGVKTSAATPTTAVRYDETDLDGAEMDGTLGVLANGVPRAISVTTGASVGTYRTGASYPIVVRGRSWRTGQAVAESLLLTAANGGETISGTVLMSPDHAITIDVPAQVDGSGTFEFGTTVAVAIDPPAHSINAHDTSGGSAIVYRLSHQPVTSTPLTGGTPAVHTQLPWEVSELHVGTTAAGIVAHYGVPRRVA